MTTSDIITGRFVRISQATASVGERAISRIIDMVTIVIYAFAMFFLLAFFVRWSDAVVLVYVLTGLLPATFYSFICETFCHGQTLGKHIMKLRVVKADGSVPGVGDFLLRWMLLLVDLHFCCVGLVVMLCTRRNQRLGDLAAGTLVVRMAGYKKKRITLDEFRYARHDYRPVYPEAAHLSLAQADVIRKAIYGSERFNGQQTARLSAKIQKTLGIKPAGGNDTKFLVTLLHDYQYYALELI